ncbi:MAG: thioesterase family protein [Acidobacteriota bacterium]
MTFSHSFNVAADDIDEQGHVNNVAYLRWIQDVAVAHWRHAATEKMIAKYSWITVRHEIDYKKQAFVEEKITATTWVGEWTKVTCERFTEIHRGEDLLVKSRTVWCMIDRETSRPTRIMGDLVSLFI